MTSEFFQPFDPQPIQLPELKSISKDQVGGVDALDEMITDKKNLELVLQYVKNQINLSRKVSSGVPHKGSLEEVQQALDRMVDFWSDYEEGPRALGEATLTSFQGKYKADDDYAAQYKTQYEQVLEELKVGGTSEMQKELKTAYQFHHVSRSADLNHMLHENEQTYRKICVDNCSKRILTKMRAASKAKNPTKDAGLLSEASAMVEKLSLLSSGNEAPQELKVMLENW